MFTSQSTVTILHPCKEYLDRKRKSIPKKINAHDLYFVNPDDFKKLWPNHKDFYKKYRVKGKATKLDKYSLLFKVESFQPIALKNLK